MAFFINGVVGDRQPNARTYLEAVQRVVRATGQDVPTSITGTSPNHIGRAKQSVDDAMQRVWNACLWDFRYVWAYLGMEDGVVWYDLPGDWQARATELLPMNYENGSTGDAETHRMGVVRFLDYHRMVASFPKFCLPNEDIISTAGLTHILRASSYLHEEISGIPQYFTIAGSKLGLYPAPDEDEDNFEIFSPLMIAYWQKLKDLELNDDEVPLPPNLLVPMHNLALSYYKQSMEYADFEADEARGERQLFTEVAKALQVAGNTQHNHVSEEYGRL